MLNKTNSSTGANARRGMLRIIATTDLHGALVPHDYFTDTPTPGVGLLALSTTIAKLRDTTATTLLLDNGDFLQGTPMTDAVVIDDGWNDTHPMIAAMNALGYDAITLGNHEFNFGLGALNAAIEDFAGSVVSANVLQRETGSTYVDPFVILNREVRLDDGTTEQVCIGVLGLAPPQIAIWDARVVGNEIAMLDMRQAAMDQIPRMKAAGADIIIVMAHTGIGADEPTELQENAAVPLAALDGIDALILGHTHMKFPSDAANASPYIDGQSGTIHGKPAIMPAAIGQGVGHIDLSLEREGTGWRVSSFASGLHPSDESGPDDVMETPALIARAHAKSLDLIRTPIGMTKRPLQSYFSRVSNCAIVQLINDAQRNMITTEIAQTQAIELPVLSVASAFKSGGRGGARHYVDIPIGPLAINNAAEMYSFPNTICAAVLTGLEITNWLERAASVFSKIEQGGGEQRLIDPNFPSYDFDVFDGLTYLIDLTQPAKFGADGRIIHPSAQRVTELRHEGLPVLPDAEFIVATNNYRIGGGGGFFEPDPSRVIADTRKAARDVLIDYIKANSPLDHSVRATWSFSGIEGAVGLFETGPEGPEFAKDVFDRELFGFSHEPDGRTIGRLALAPSVCLQIEDGVRI